MKLKYVTLTGADDSVDPGELIELSNQYPWIEWGILMSKKRMGTPRYPSREWLDNFQMSLGDADVEVHASAHLCGKLCTNMIKAMQKGIPLDVETTLLEPFGLTYLDEVFNRVQLNFNAHRVDFGVLAIEDFIIGSNDPHNTTGIDAILQFNDNNRDFVATIPENVIRNLHLLHDASGGRGKAMTALPQPIGGVLTGYAGGINPGNVITLLDTLHEEIYTSGGWTWIDMESGIRTDDDKFDLDGVKAMLSNIDTVGRKYDWFH